MNEHKHIARVDAVIPALNEEATIGGVVKTFKESRLIRHVVVVDDGSTDRTAQNAEQNGAIVIRQNNQGKGKAMRAGAQYASADFILFADADLIGFSTRHADALIEPVLNGEAGMTIGLRDRGPLLTRVLPFIAPVLGGERVIGREFFLTLGGSASADFGIETVMNAVCRKRHIPVRCIPLWGVKQVIKERKYGFWKGLVARMRMVGQVMRAQIEVLFSKDL